jgi:hypothetical protein
MSLKIELINALAELDRLGYRYEPIGEEEIRFCCPAHKDESPSATMNVKKNLWKCHAASCGKDGDVVTLIALIANVSRFTVVEELSTRYGIRAKKKIDPRVVEKHHEQIWSAGPLLKALYDRGLTDEMIRRARLGYHEGRIIIPVYDAAGDIVNLRRYLPGAPGAEKMKNVKGYGGVRLYMPKQIEYPTIWLCGGEMKAIVAASLLNQHNIGATTYTAGEGNYDPSTGPLFKDKRVYLCMDIDDGGTIAINKLAPFLRRFTSSLHIIDLPLERSVYPKGDINDYVGSEGATDQDLLSLMVNARKWEPANRDDIDQFEDEKKEEPEKPILSEATLAKYVGRRIEVAGVISAMDQTPFLIPKNINASCTKDQNNCERCPIFPESPDKDSGLVHLTVKGTSIGVLEMVNAPKSGQREAIMNALRIPPCKAVTLTVESYFNVTEIRITPQLHIGNRASENVMQPAFCIGQNFEMNSPYKFRGRVHPAPKSQQAVLLLDEAEAGDDSLNMFEPTEEQLSELKIFQPSSWTAEAVNDKWNAIHEDFSSNVTRIFKRPELHLGIDLTFHSVLSLPFDGRAVKGWINSLIIGDSSQGKSETAIRLMEHYGLGERVDCKNASVAGLLGGLQQFGTSRWFVSWGVIPTHDRRLVVMEEVKGADPEVLAKLTDMRSSGIAELPKIEKRRAYARTRLIFISNPRSGRPMSAYNFGIEAIRELMGGLEDIRRFDFALVAAEKQVSSSVINEMSRKVSKNDCTFAPNLCRRLVLWSWTRDVDEVVIDSKTNDVIVDQAIKLCGLYSEALPLVDKGTMRHKLARLAAAMAARTFSTTTGSDLVVRPCHVEFVAKFLQSVYDSQTFGYRDFSQAQTFASQVRDPDIVKKHIIGTKHPKDFVDSLLFADEITASDIADWCEADSDIVKTLVSLLVRKHALYRKQRCYYKTDEFIVLLKQMKAEGLPETGKSTGKESF